MNINPRRMLQIAGEWATELGKFKGHELLAAEIASWGFLEVEKGRPPDTVLKEVLVKIQQAIANEERILDWDKAKSASSGQPDAGNEDGDAVDPQSSEPHRVRNGESGPG